MSDCNDVEADEEFQADDSLKDIDSKPAIEDQPELSHRNIHSYYGPTIGFMHVISLILNVALMAYAQVSTSAIIYSSQDPSLTTNANSVNANNNTIIDNSTTVDAKCNTQDIELWKNSGGEAMRPTQSSFCSREYNDGGCLIDTTCIQTCFEETYGYSSACSSCFANIPSCGVSIGCTFICAKDSLSDECQQCNGPCIAEFDTCSGFPVVDAPQLQNNITLDNTTLTASNQATAPYCNSFDLSAITVWYSVYNLTFFRSLKDAWNGGAKLLAVIIFLFSGIWPYVKKILVAVVWFLPMSLQKQNSILLWLTRLSKYTLVDVFAVITLLVAVQLQLNIGGTDAIIRAEPRFGIIAFLLSTVWEYLQVEILKTMYEKKVTGQNDLPNTGKQLCYRNKSMTLVVFIFTIGLYISGNVLDIVYFTSVDDSGICKRSYNLAMLGNALINEESMTANGVPGQNWTLYMSYVLLNLVFPILTHTIQLFLIIGWTKAPHFKTIFKWSTAIWCFACVEILFIGIFAIEFKFEKLIMRIAGDSNSGFLQIESGLSAGFYLLIAYIFVAGFLQFLLFSQQNEAGK